MNGEYRGAMNKTRSRCLYNHIHGNNQDNGYDELNTEMVETSSVNFSPQFICHFIEEKKNNTKEVHKGDEMPLLHVKKEIKWNTTRNNTKGKVNYFPFNITKSKYPLVVCDTMAPQAGVAFPSNSYRAFVYREMVRSIQQDLSLRFSRNNLTLG